MRRGKLPACGSSRALCWARRRGLSARYARSAIRAGIQLSGMAAEDARNPQIMMTTLVMLGTCSIAFGAALRRTAWHRSAGPWLVMAPGAAAAAPGAF